MASTLLIVDDEQDVGRTFAETLQHTATVLLANADDPSRDALRLLQERPEITHVLVDSNMPDLKGDRNREAGFELIDVIRQTLGRPVRLMINTAHHQVEEYEPKARSRDVPMRGKEDPPDDLIAWLADGPSRRTTHRPTEAERRLSDTFHWINTDVAVRREHSGRLVAARADRELVAWADDSAGLIAKLEKAGIPRNELVFGRVPVLWASESEQYRGLLQDPLLDPYETPFLAVADGQIFGRGPDRAAALAHAGTNHDTPRERLTLLLLR